MKIAVIVGTRPEIIKMSPIIREFQKRKINFFIIHSGQHYSYNMDEIFFKQLELPSPDYNLQVGSSSHSEQTAKIMVGIEKILKKEIPDIVLVQGDTNTVMAGAIVAAKLNIKVGHVEAGLRSYYKKMPEEINRIIADHCSDFLFAPTEYSKKIMISEGIKENSIYVTGNTIVDAVYQNLAIIKKNKNNLLDIFGVKEKKYFLATVHRQENIEDRDRFKEIISGLETTAREFDFPLLLPIHPHSKNCLHKFNIKTKNITLIDPLDYLSFLLLESSSRLILTDSGGVQEEACILHVPCVTLRDNTERPETIDINANKLAGANKNKIIETVKVMMKVDTRWVNPFGDGKTSIIISEILEKEKLY